MQTPKRGEKNILTEWYFKGVPQNRPENYDVKSLIFLPQHGNGYSVVDTNSQKLFGVYGDLEEN